MSKNKKSGTGINRRDSNQSTTSVEPQALNKFHEKSNIYGQSIIVAEIDQFGAQKGDDEDYLTAQGEVFLKTNSGLFKKRFCLVMGNEIYFQKSQDSLKHDFMHCLTGTFLDIPEKVEVEGQSYFPIKVQIGAVKSRVLYLDSLEKREAWEAVLKQASGFSDVGQFYEFGEALGKGQFGLVRKAVHKRTKIEVAVKQIKKKKISNDELDMLRNEIEVLKVCKHPNVVQLYDVFEDRKNIFIIMELIQGEDLYEYLDKRDFKLPDIRVKQIAYSLSLGLNYLHTYGIMHRDIKLQNIMMTNNTDAAEPKLVDFGFAKILGPAVFENEYFGSQGYVAPEVIVKANYWIQIDVWSLAVVIYALYTGALPFASYDKKEMDRMVVQEPLKFDKPGFERRTLSAKTYSPRCSSRTPKTASPSTKSFNTPTSLKSLSSRRRKLQPAPQTKNPATSLLSWASLNRSPD